MLRNIKTLFIWKIMKIPCFSEKYTPPSPLNFFRTIKESGNLSASCDRMDKALSLLERWDVTHGKFLIDFYWKYRTLNGLT